MARNARSAGDVVGVAGGDGAPERENTLRSAWRHQMMGLTALISKRLTMMKNAWMVVEEFDGYRQIWHKRGVMPMLRALSSARNIAENLAGAWREANVG